MTYLQRLAHEIRRAVPAHLVPPDSNGLFLIYAVLATSKGEAVTAEDVHSAWVAWMELRGERHESMAPFSELPQTVREQDAPFVRAIKEVAIRGVERVSGMDQGQ